MSDATISGSCHCGKVTFSVAREPKWLTECNCSICRRIGALWAHYEREDVAIDAADNTIAYVQGHKTLAVHTCSICGCTTHWDSLSPRRDARMAVNYRMCDLDRVARIPIRHFDGADSWKYLD
jgi:hypothetical protein